jgi:DNA-binding NarL/FixJ family response regulator
MVASSFVGVLARSPRDPSSLVECAHHAELAARPVGEVGWLWDALLDGRLRYCASGDGARGPYALCRSSASSLARASGAHLAPVERTILTRVLRGEQQKAVALELGMARSTASKWYTAALFKLNLAGRPLPLALIVAAQAWGPGPVTVAARLATVEYHGQEFVYLGISRPDARGEDLLTSAERNVAELLLEGDSRREIAVRRATSVQTVACQVRRIFAKLRVKGRCALAKRAVDAGWLQSV